MRPVGLLLAGMLLVIGCTGCTKKEELLFLSGETDETESAFSENAGETALSEEEGDGELAASAKEMSDEQPLEADFLYVHVCGAVKRPGVYELAAGCRVYEAVQAAGGFAADADQNYVNQAQVLEDGVKLVIPTGEETAALKAQGEDGGSAGTAQAQSGAAAELGIIGGAGAGQESSSGTADGKININTATEAELCNIPGIGATRAAAIAAYRESHGGFQKPEDIMKVNGIKEGMYEKIKDSISVN